MSDSKSSISEIVDFNPKRNIKKGDIAPFIEMSFLPTDSRDISEIGKREFKGSGSKFVNGDTLFSRITPCLENGKTAKVSGLPEGVAASGSTEFIVMAAKNPSYDEDYVYYLARLPEFRLYAQARMEGTSGRQRVPWQSLAEFEFSFPEKHVRKQIGDYLKGFDDKLALNRQINQTLEEMAQAVFKSWFVDFDPVRAKIAAKENGQDPTRAAMAAIAGKTTEQLDTLPSDQLKTLSSIAALFPDALVESELGEIPEGWGRQTLEDLLELHYGKALKKNDRIEGEFPVYGSGGVTGTHNKQLVDGPGIIVGRKGTVGSLYWEDQSFFPIDTVFYVRCKGNVSLEYAFYLLQTFGLEGMNTDAAVPGLNRNNAYRLAVPKVPDSLIDGYSVFTKALRNKMKICREETRSLEQIRDTLLPKLLSGEIDLSEAV